MTTEQQRKARGEAFGYVCHRCMNCCHDKIIQVNPYEIAHLARRLGETTGAFSETRTHGGEGTSLARTDDGACVFLGAEGCTVHPDRPLVCRIYPLGRHVEADGTERWSHATPHPRTAGVYSKQGTIADFIANQDADLFIKAADEYAAWLRRACEVLDEATEADELAVELSDADLLDMDGAIAAHCEASGVSEPANLEARKALHLAILGQSLDDFAGGDR
ncbi:MAG: YkgJ family cysteine cluster protein [Caulobacterales bacterium]